MPIRRNSAQSFALNGCQVSPRRDQFRIDGVTLDDATLARRSLSRQERKGAIYDLLGENHFHPKGSKAGRTISPRGRRQSPCLRRAFERAASGRDSFADALQAAAQGLHCNVRSYYAALHEAPARLEAIDMGRRGMHDDGARLLHERLEGKISIDFLTARRLFTLLCALSL
jgi:uncharacterized protein (UPF0262 family)